jgi:hypothetical protein
MEPAEEGDAAGWGSLAAVSEPVFAPGRNPYEQSRKSASKIGSRINRVAICTTRSRTVAETSWLIVAILRICLNGPQLRANRSTRTMAACRSGERAKKFGQSALLVIVAERR